MIAVESFRGSARFPSMKAESILRETSQRSRFMNQGRPTCTATLLAAHTSDEPTARMFIASFACTALQPAFKAACHTTAHTSYTPKTRYPLRDGTRESPSEHGSFEAHVRFACQRDRSGVRPMRDLRTRNSSDSVSKDCLMSYCSKTSATPR